MLPTYCPSCHNQLKIKSLHCEQCNTEVIGSYEMPILNLLSVEEQEFIIKFIKCSGSLKDMASQLKLSYPTVRNILNNVIKDIEDREK